MSSFVNFPGGAVVSGRSGDRWLGVRASRSRGSSDTLVMGRPFTTDSTSHIRVRRSSSSNPFFFIIAFITFLTVLIHLSHTPPWCEPVGGLKVHLISCCSRNSWTCCWFQALTACRSFFSPLTKLPPLSERISYGCPLLAMKRLKALMKDSVSKEWTTSMWTARTTRYVKSTPYILTLLLPRRASNGPKQSTPTWVKGGLEGVILSSGRLAIFCCGAAAWRRLQSRQVLMVLRMLDLALMIQNLCLIMDNVCSRPECPAAWW